MADGKQYGKGQRDQQLTATPEEARAAQIDGRLKDLHTCLPGIIAAFDPVTQTASVQPAIKRIFTEKGPVNLPLCVDVPVQFPGGGGFFLTFPVAAGDECTLYFSERCIDFWHANGGTQLPAEYRLHDLSDAIAAVGLNSQPNKISAFSATDTELRNRARTVRVTLKPDGTIENVNQGGRTTLSAAGKFTIVAPGGFEVNAPHSQINSDTTTINGNETVVGTELVQGAITGQGGLAVSGGTGASVTGNMTVTGGDITADGKSVKTHVHSGVQPGAGNSGQPV